MSGPAAGSMLGGVPAPPQPDPGDLAWETVPDAPGLLRALVVKADGRRLTVYRQSAAGGS